jgi:hypothetical protein
MRLLRDHSSIPSSWSGSHFVGFDGVSAFCGTGFETPLGIATIDRSAPSL